MSIHIEVTCETTESGECLCLSGEGTGLGAWDVSKAIRFQTDISKIDSVWSAEIPMPTGGQFKFVILSSTGAATWEPLETARSWPSSGLSVGATFRTRFGELKMTVEASTDQIERQARSYKDLGERRGSALQEDLDRKGTNAYYHAHNRDYVVPDDAKVVRGEGLVNGGPPVLLEVGAETTTEDDRTMWLKDYSWSDSGKKVKVYVPIAEGVLPADGAEAIVETTYNATNIDLVISSRPKQRLKIEKLNADISPELSSTRVEANKNRIVLQLAKKRESTTWYNLTKSK